MSRNIERIFRIIIVIFRIILGCYLFFIIQNLIETQKFSPQHEALPWLTQLGQQSIMAGVVIFAYLAITSGLLFADKPFTAWLVYAGDALLCFVAIATYNPLFFPVLLVPPLILGTLERRSHVSNLVLQTILQMVVLLGLVLGNAFLTTGQHLNLMQLIFDQGYLLQLGFLIIVLNFMAGVGYHSIFRAIKESRQAEGLLNLIEVGQRMGSTLNYEKVSTQLMNVLSQMFDAHTYGLYVIEEKMGEKMALLKGIDSPYSQVFLDFNVDIKESVLSDTLAEKKIRLVDDLHVVKDRILTKLSTFRGGLFVPICFEENVLGLVFIISSTKGAFDKEQKTIMEILAKQFAVALKNVHLYQETATMAITDSLTGLYTHGYFQDQLAKAITTHKYAEKPLSLIILDVDHFKVINDNFGHPQGDYILRQMAGLIKGSVRPEDIVSRYGGDEFVLIIPGLDRMSSAVYAERIRKTVEDYSFIVGSKTVNITLSAGVASFPERGETSKELIEAADKALYEAKARGRNRIVYL